MVLAGADAVVFVADSTPGRERDNRASLEELIRNLGADGRDPNPVPVLVQFNKQDVEGALVPVAMEHALGPLARDGRPAVAVHGRGVVDTFLDAGRAMLERLVRNAPATIRDDLDPAALAAHLDRAFEPIRARGATARSIPALPADGVVAPGAVRIDASDDADGAARTSLALGELWTAERGRADRLDREARALRQLSEMLRTTAVRFDAGIIVDRALDVVLDVAGCATASLLAVDGADDGIRAVRVRGRDHDPLLTHRAGRAFLSAVATSAGACVVDDLTAEFGPDGPWDGLRAAVAMPVDGIVGRVLVGYAPGPDGAFDEADVRFLATVAAHLGLGLEKSVLVSRLAAQRDRLEAQVADRTESLRNALEELRSLEQVKDRFLGNVSHEMRTPLTSILTAATFLRDYPDAPGSRSEMLDTILASGTTLRGLIDDLLRAVSTGGPPVAPRFERVRLDGVVRDGIRAAGSPDVEVVLDDAEAICEVDPDRVARAVGALLDNARKFSAPGAEITLRVRTRDTDGQVDVEVLDRGPGPPAGGGQKLFEPFEQGGDGLHGKPAGVGLGLHEARSVAREHDGDLTWTAREGGGSRFVLTVPRCRPAPVRAAGVGVDA